MKTGIDPRVDFAFLWLFGSPEREPLLRSLVNAVLEGVLARPIVRLRLRNPLRLRRRVGGKLAILDVDAEDDAGRIYLLEMQMRVTEHFPVRALYYWAATFREQLSKGAGYQSLRPTIGIQFLAENLFPNPDRRVSVFQLRERADGSVLTDCMTLVFVELEKFRKSAGELKNDLERWIYLLRHGAELDPQRLPKGLATPTIREALEALETMGKSPADRRLYEARLRAKRDAISDLYEANAKGLALGMAQGIAEGTAQGKAEGKAEGIAEGEAAGRRATLREYVEFRHGDDGLALLRKNDSHDLETLRTMFRQATAATSLGELRTLWDGKPRKPSPGR